MISLILGSLKDQHYFDLTCDHGSPVIYNTYAGCFCKDYVEEHKGRQVISLFNTFDPVLFKEKIEGNGSVFQLLEDGIRVYLGKGDAQQQEQSITPFSDAVFSSLERYLTNAVGKKNVRRIQVDKGADFVYFNVINVAFSVKGSSNYLICFSINEALSTYFLKKLVAEDGVHQDLHELIVDSIAEICNTIVGNAFSVFQDHQGPMHLGTPIIFRFARDEKLVSNHPMTVAEIQINELNIKTIVLYLDEVKHG